MLTMYLARHGETEENRAQILQGQTGGHLTELGISQAHKLGEKLADEVFDAVISSPLKRAVDTTNIVLGYGHENEIELCDLLKAHRRHQCAGKRLGRIYSAQLCRGTQTGNAAAKCGNARTRHGTRKTICQSYVQKIRWEENSLRGTRIHKPLHHVHDIWC